VSYERRWIALPATDKGDKKRKIMINKSAFNIRKLKNIMSFVMKIVFYFKKPSNNHKPSQYNPHRKSSGYCNSFSLGLVQSI